MEERVLNNVDDRVTIEKLALSTKALFPMLTTEAGISISVMSVSRKTDPSRVIKEVWISEEPRNVIDMRLVFEKAPSSSDE